MSQGVLGKGLSALIPDDVKRDLSRPAADLKIESPADTATATSAADEGGERIHQIELDHIVPNSRQPRKEFKQEQLEGLAESIKQFGVLQPVTVVDAGNGVYELISGERRLRASKIAGQTTIPAIIRTADEVEKLELALIENIQRENLNPIEEGKAYQKLIDDFGMTQEEISQKVRKGRSSIANYLRYLRLPEEIQQGLVEGTINEGHAKILAAIEDKDAQLALFRKSVKDNLTVRNIESIAEDITVRSHKRKPKVPVSPVIAQKEKIISDYFGLKTKIKPGSKGGGRIVIEYFNQDDLERIAQRLEGMDAENPQPAAEGA